MDLSKAQVLITGGSEGIGKGLAVRFAAAGSRITITGRNPEKLAKAAQEIPGIQIYQNDISDAAQRELLAKHVQEHIPGLNILINNAGIQRRVALAADHALWSECQAEIDTLFSAPVHLNSLLIPLLLKNSQSLIVNVTSGGAYIPQVFAPVYSACKAALHSYTLTLRHALANTSCKVIELIPPAVQTALAGPGMNHGVTLDEFCDKVFPLLAGGNQNEIGFGPTENIEQEISGQPLAALFKASASRFPVEVYPADKNPS